MLYLIEFLHQTTTPRQPKACRLMLYLIEFLHQTTTCPSQSLCLWCCILLNFYIKPQLSASRNCVSTVVSYWISTSNHNPSLTGLISTMLYLIEFLHQTTTRIFAPSRRMSLYLIEFLHQTTTGKSQSAWVNWLYLIEFLHQTTTW